MAQPSFCGVIAGCVRGYWQSAPRALAASVDQATLFVENTRGARAANVTVHLIVRLVVQRKKSVSCYEYSRDQNQNACESALSLTCFCSSAYYVRPCKTNVKRIAHRVSIDPSALRHSTHYYHPYHIITTRVKQIKHSCTPILSVAGKTRCTKKKRPHRLYLTEETQQTCVCMVSEVSLTQILASAEQTPPRSNAQSPPLLGYLPA